MKPKRKQRRSLTRRVSRRELGVEWIPGGKENPLGVVAFKCKCHVPFVLCPLHGTRKAPNKDYATPVRISR